MAEVLVEFSDPVADEDGITYAARACGAEGDNGHWLGWIEFVPADGGEVARSGRETTQPNRTDTLYWATGLTTVYLEGALKRALKPLVRRPSRPIPPPAHDAPAPDFRPPPVADGILDPFSVYRKGETPLRSQLGALSEWHLVNIVRAYDLSAMPEGDLNRLSAAQLIELIVTEVRSRSAEMILK